ncbi:hypothetical protein EXIGLDRAFT_731491 [Exidia glandulosa HHB12029]|uniref:Uncharacterized protein n=1 Tax=Exidia glandulosa HHB12029 TaxID=1314781 RepID=A0A165L1X7_EXIGL|nr:hypothetical protein EXIGLDRAFT_731491 [Exidia glandulosa HHB12029]
MPPTARSATRTPMGDVSNLSVPVLASSKSLKRPLATVDNDEPAPPDGYIAINNFATELWSAEALDIVHEMGKEANRRNPDLHGICVYGDYFTYALYDLVESRLREWRALFTGDSKSMEAWYLLEAITYFVAVSGDAFDSIDDGDRFFAFVHLFCSAWHTMAKRLHTAIPSSLLPDIPNASNVLMTAAKIVTDWGDVVGEELEDLPLLLRIMLCRDGLPWLEKSTCIMGQNGEKPGDEPPRKKSKMQSSISSTDKHIEQLAKLPFAQAEHEARKPRAKTYEWPKVWKKYQKDYAGGGFPIDGANGFDITKWPKRVRERYSVDNVSVYST